MGSSFLILSFYLKFTDVVVVLQLDSNDSGQSGHSDNPFYDHLFAPRAKEAIFKSVLPDRKIDSIVVNLTELMPLDSQ